MNNAAVWISGAALLLGLLEGFRRVFERLTAVETKVEVFWKSVGIDAAKILHSPDPAHARMDYLIERFEAEEITREELKEFVEKLVHRRDDKEAMKGERVAASLLLRIIEQRYTEL